MSTIILVRFPASPLRCPPTDVRHLPTADITPRLSLYRHFQYYDRMCCNSFPQESTENQALLFSVFLEVPVVEGRGAGEGASGGPLDSAAPGHVPTLSGTYALRMRCPVLRRVCYVWS